MKITLQPTGDQWKLPFDRRHFEISIAHEHDDISIDDAFALFGAALAAWGFGSELVERKLEAMRQ